MSFPHKEHTFTSDWYVKITLKKMSSNKYTKYPMEYLEAIKLANLAKVQELSY